MEAPKEIFRKKPVHYTVSLELNGERTNAFPRITVLPGSEGILVSKLLASLAGSSPLVSASTHLKLICFKVNGDDLKDHLDIMEKYTFRIEAHKSKCLFLLSGGNPFGQADTEDGKHLVYYLQGAEAVGVYNTLFRSQGVGKGMYLYFKRLDRQPVACEDCYYAMRDANDMDFLNFLQWYGLAWTPGVRETSSYDAEKQTFTLSFSKEGPASRGQSVKMPVCIPVAIGFLDSHGKDMLLLYVLHDDKMEWREVEKHKEVEWEKLPGELWEEIGKRLESRLEVDRFRSVCKSWRSVLPPWNRFPLHVPSPPGGSNFLSKNLPCFIIQHILYLIDGQFVVLKEIDQGGLFIVASYRYENIEYVHKDGASQFLHNVVDNNHAYRHLSCVSTSYHLQRAIPTFDKMGNRVQRGWTFESNVRIKKIVLVSKNITMNPSYASDIDLVVIALLNNGLLAQLKLRNLPLLWDIITNLNVAFDDIVLFHEKLCAVDSKGNAFVIPDAFSSPVKLSQIGNANNIVTSNTEELRNRLVEASGELYLLVPVEYKLIHLRLRSKIKVYKYDAGKVGVLGVWVEVKCLGNQAFFVGREHSFCITTSDDGDEYEIPLTNRIIQESFAFSKTMSMLNYEAKEEKRKKKEKKMKRKRNVSTRLWYMILYL